MLSRRHLLCTSGGAIAAGAAGLTYAMMRSPAVIRPGVDLQLAPDAPVQVAADPQTGRIARYRFQVRAAFRIDALVLSARSYKNDGLSDISPVDLALGWGLMSNPATLAEIEIWQKNRFYFWRSQSNRFNPYTIARSSANVHVVPAQGAISEKVKAARRGDIVTASGKLIDLMTSDRFWGTSLTRDDDGTGGCEILMVEKFEIRSVA